MFPVFTSESVTRGHPDKVADQISDTILDVCLAKDPMARVAAETLVKGNNVYVAGEVTVAGVTQADFEKAIRETLASIGYSDPRTGFDAKTCRIIFDLTQQSPDIDKGVNKEQGAGDQGMMFGYATDATPNMMPLPIFLANGLVRQLTELREKKVLPYLRPDGKTQVSLDFRGGKPTITHVVVSTHHSDDVTQEQIQADIIEHVIQPVCGDYLTPQTVYHINPSGRFVVGGPVADSGLTGRKIMVDTYGSWISHGGGAFSGKEPFKVDRSAAYAARWVAKHVVAAGLAKDCLVQVSYAIGKAEPLSLLVHTHHTGAVPNQVIEQAVRKVFDLSCLPTT